MVPPNVLGETTIKLHEGGKSVHATVNHLFCCTKRFTISLNNSKRLENMKEERGETLTAVSFSKNDPNCL